MSQPTEYNIASTVLGHLPDDLRATRAKYRISLRRAANQIGLHFTTLDRIERRQIDPSTLTARLILNWMDHLSRDAS